MAAHTNPVQSLIQNASWFFSASIFALVVGFVVKTVLARYLGPTGLGYFTLALYFPELAALFLRLGLPTSNIFFIGSGKITEQAAFSNCFSVAIVLSAVATTLYLISLPLIKSSFLKDMPYSLAVLGAFSLALALMDSFSESILQARERLREMSLVRASQVIVWGLLILVLVIGFEWGALGAVLSYLLRGGFGLAVFIYFLSYSIKIIPGIDLSLLKQQLSYGLKTHFGIIMLFLNSRLDIFFIMYFLGIKEVGIYTLAVIISEALWKAAESVQAAIFPRIAATQGSAEFTLQVQTGVAAVTALGALALVLLGQPLILLVFSPAFAEAYTVIVYLCPGIIALTFAMIFNADLVARGYPWVVMGAAAAGLPFTIILNPVLIPHLGIKGAAITSSVCYLANGIYSIVIFSRRSNVCYSSILATLNPVRWWKLAMSFKK